MRRDTTIIAAAAACGVIFSITVPALLVFHANDGKGTTARCDTSSVVAGKGLVTTITPASPRLSAYFSPTGGCTDAVVAAVDSAKSTVLVQAYSFTSTPIAKALAQANRRGVKVLVILDKSQRTERYTSADFIVHAGIPTFVDARHAIAHNKVMVIDDEMVVTGSFNFTNAAEDHNAENLLIVRDRELAELYTKNWGEHRQHSEEYRNHAGSGGGHNDGR